MDRLGKFLLRIGYLRFSLLLVLILILHTGFRLPWRPDEDFYMVANSWPGGSSWDTSPLWIKAPHSLGLTDYLPWTALWAATATAVFVVVMWTAKVLIPEPTQRHFLVTVMASGIGLLLTSQLGFYDVPFILGVAITALLPRFWWVIGVVLLSGSNSEMGIAAGAAALLVGIATRSRDVIIRSTTTVSFALGVTILVHAFRFINQGTVSSSRISLLTTNAPEALAANLTWFPLLVSSMYLGAWIAVAFAASSNLAEGRRGYLVAGLIFLPLIATLFTLDGTRVAVATSSLAFLFAMRMLFSDAFVVTLFKTQPAAQPMSLSLLVILMVATPAVSIFVPMPTESQVPPWQSLYLLLWP